MSLRYASPEDKKMYMVVIFAAGSMFFGIAGEALPIFGGVLFPLAAFCAVGFVLAWMGPAEKLFPLRSFPRRVAPAAWSWTISAVKALLFFGGISAVLYVVFRAIR